MRGIRRSQSAGYRINRQRDALDSPAPFAQVGNRTKIGPLRGENPVRSGFVILSWRRWNSQFNKLRRDGSLPIQARSDLVLLCVNSGTCPGTKACSASL